MITRLTGLLNRVLDEEARLQVGHLEYQVLVPEFIRRQIQDRLGGEITFHTCHYFEGNPMQGRVVPRLVGFLKEGELDFFELFCTVEKIGIRKALKALALPIGDIARAIQREDAKWLTSLPGIGSATAEHIITTLKRKVTRFSLALTGGLGSPAGLPEDGPPSPINGQLFEETYQALLVLGHSPLDARAQLDRVLKKQPALTSVEEILQEIYKK